MKNKKIWWLIGGVLFIVLLIIGATSQNGNKTSANDATPTTITSHATQAPTSKPTPTATLTTEQRAIQLAQQAAPSASKQSVKIDSSGGLTITEFRDVVTQTTVKTDCFNVLQALWKAGLPGINDIDLEITATLTDASGNTSVGSVGDCSLSHALNWSGLTWQSAWNAYDTQFVDPALSN